MTADTWVSDTWSTCHKSTSFYSGSPPKKSVSDTCIENRVYLLLFLLVPLEYGLGYSRVLCCYCSSLILEVSLGSVAVISVSDTLITNL